jgi:WhiB family transcriptional regulator, redox-sensing transcriptional regulator
MADSRRTALSQSDQERLRPVSDEWNWQFSGKCRGYPSELFFPDDERGPRRRLREERARRICLDCPVIAECLRHALTVQEPAGIWGGKTARERAALLRRRAG